MTLQERQAQANTLIKEMQVLRDLHKLYFKYREAETLTKCRIQEKIVDDLIIEYNKPIDLFTKS